MNRTMKMRGRSRKLALAPLLLAAVAACTTPFKADVSRFQTQLPAPQGQSFAVVADDPALAGGLEFARYADLVDAQMALQQQPQEQRGNGVRLAGSGTGFDQTPTLERDLEDVQRFHRVTSCVRWRSSGANTCCEASTKVGKPAKGR